jgi:type IV secretory pathway TrbD component
VSDAPEGFEVPVYRAALKPKLSLGAPRDWTFLVSALFALSVLYKLWPVLPLVAILHTVAIWGTRQDEHWFEKVARVIRTKRYYKP